MWITRFVAEHVVTTMDRHPADQRSFECHRPCNRKDHLQDRIRLEAAMGEQAMKAGSNSETREEVQGGRQNHVAETRETPSEYREHCERNQRSEHEKSGHDPARGRWWR